MVESREEKFKRLAEKRVNVALDKIRIVGNLANPQYAFSPEQIETIITALQSAITEVEGKFQKPLEKNKKRFVL